MVVGGKTEGLPTPMTVAMGVENPGWVARPVMYRRTEVSGDMQSKHRVGEVML